MKTILLPFYDDDAAEAALDVSRQLADRYGSYVEGLFVMRPPQIIDGEGIVLADSYLTQLKEEGGGSAIAQGRASTTASRGARWWRAP